MNTIPQAIEDSVGLVVGIDASRNRSGGAIANLIGVLNAGDPQTHGVDEVHVWSYKKLLESLPNTNWLIKHNPPELQKSLLRQVWWQYHELPKTAALAGCDILFATDAASVCRFNPMVVMSQDMLSYEPGVMKHFGISKARLRLIALLLIQNSAMKSAGGVIFLTRYASRIIQNSTGRLSSIAIVPHGVDCAFKIKTSSRSWPNGDSRPIRCLYVSNVAMYKHQWNVVRAVTVLRARGRNIELVLAGGGAGRAQKLLDDEIAKSNQESNFVELIGFVKHNELSTLLNSADLFVFASSCENLPVTLLEAMAAGLPIACSDRGPMPEILQDGGVYFDPEDFQSIAAAIERIVVNQDGLRDRIASRAQQLSECYSWARCAAETWDFIRTTAERQGHV